MRKACNYLAILILFIFAQNIWAIADYSLFKNKKTTQKVKRKVKRPQNPKTHPWHFSLTGSHGEVLSSRKSAQSSFSIINLAISKKTSARINWAGSLGLLSKETPRYERETLLTNMSLSSTYISRLRGRHRLNFTGEAILPTNKTAAEYDSYRGSLSPQISYEYKITRRYSFLAQESIYLNFHEYQTSAGGSNNSQVSNSLFLGLSGRFTRNISANAGFNLEESWSYYGSRQGSIGGLLLSTQLNMKSYALGLNYRKSNRIDSVAGEINGEDQLFELDNYRLGIFLKINI